MNHRLLAAGVIGAAALSLPAAASAETGTVLQVDRSHHAIRTLTGRDAVHVLHYRGRLPARVRPGTIIRWSGPTRHVTRLRAIRQVRVARLYGKVLDSGPVGTTVALAGGQPLSLPALSLSFSGLQPGDQVVVTLSFPPSGGVSVAIALTRPAPQPADQSSGDGSGDQSSGDQSSGDQSSGDQSSGDQQCAPQDAIDGRVVGINHRDGLFTLGRSWNDRQTYTATAAELSSMQVGDVVLVHFTANDGSLPDATAVSVLQSDAGSTLDANESTYDGTIVAVDNDASQITLAPHDGGARIVLDAPCWVLNEVSTAEDVHVVAHTDPSGDLVVDTYDANDGSSF